MNKIFDFSQKQALALTLIYLIHDGQILLIKRSPEKEMVAEKT